MNRCSAGPPWRHEREDVASIVDRLRANDYLFEALFRWKLQISFTCVRVRSRCTSFYEMMLPDARWSCSSIFIGSPCSQLFTRGLLTSQMHRVCISLFGMNGSWYRFWRNISFNDEDLAISKLNFSRIEDDVPFCWKFVWPMIDVCLCLFVLIFHSNEFYKMSKRFCDTSIASNRLYKWHFNRTFVSYYNKNLKSWCNEIFNDALIVYYRWKFQTEQMKDKHLASD